MHHHGCPITVLSTPSLWTDPATFDRTTTIMSETFAGVDTHSQFHVWVIIDQDAHRLSHGRVEATPEGLDELATIMRQAAVTRIGMEGTSSYGLAATSLLTSLGLEVVEVTGPDRATRRRQGKSDLIDAEQAAHAARTQTRTRPAKNHTQLLTLRLHYDLRDSAVAAQTAVGNEIFHALVMTTGTRPDPITVTRARALATGNNPSNNPVHPAIRMAAQRWLTLHAEAAEHHQAITSWLEQRHQELLDQPGCGPISAAALVLAAGDNPARLTSEANFAALCGTAPVPIASGNHQRVRLNRGGDRQANRALHTIAMHRIQRDPTTKTYITRRTTTDHKTTKEARRCLKRYICRDLYRILKNTPQPTQTA